MVRRVVNPGNAGTSEGGASQSAAPNLAPVSDGGTALNLRTAADAMDGLNLFGDDAGQDDGAETPRGQKAPRGRKRDDATDDANAGSQDDDADDAGADNPGGDQGGDTDDADAGDDGQQSGDDQGDNTGDDSADDGNDQQPIETLAQLAEALEVDDNFLSNLQVSFKADGEDVTVSLDELRRGYQRDANYRRQTQELAETRRTLETEAQQRGQHYEAQLVQLGHVLQQGEQMLVGQLDTAEMQQLRQTNPAEWAARREELSQRINGVKQLYAFAAQQYDAYQQQQAEQLQGQLSELRRREMDNLRLALPEWGDELRGKLTGYLNDAFGFTADDLKTVFDSRLILLANKARLYDELQAVGDKTRKKVVTLPKVQKPGKGGKPGASRETVNIRKASQRLKQTGKLRDAADLIGLKVKDL